ncbi:putative Zinc finger, RING-type [Plasmopara halstedii]
MVWTQDDADVEYTREVEVEDGKEEQNQSEEDNKINIKVQDLNVETKRQQEYNENDQEREHKTEESEDEVQFMGSTDVAKTSNGREGNEEKQEEDVVTLPSCKFSKDQSITYDQSRAKTNVTPATLEAELQCIICHCTMFKPVSAICGHSFCRVCLLDSLLTRSMEETSCPICRTDIMQFYSVKVSLVSVFSVNVTLWSVIQLLIPSIATRISSYQIKEEQEFKRKLDQLSIMWNVSHLKEHAAIYHEDNEERETGLSTRRDEEHRRHDEYPVLRVEDTRDGNLQISRNIVLDTHDANEDGYMNMRVGMALVDFPSVFELYNEHQECSVNVIKMEEDEEVTDGMPFFMNEDGDDDALVCSSYYNEICLRVCDDAGICLMERTRGAHGGVVVFPGLRLDVPGGLYTFRFTDDLYGLQLSVTTQLRMPDEISDTPVADFISLINNEARDGSRRQRRQNDDSDSEDGYDQYENESDDSFIVNDDVHNKELDASFSDDDEEKDVIDDRKCRRSRRKIQTIEEHADEMSSEDDEYAYHNVKDAVKCQESDNESDVRSSRRNNRVVDDVVFSSDSEAACRNVLLIGNDEKDHEEHENIDIARPRHRNANQILDSEDEDECGHVKNEKSFFNKKRLDQRKRSDSDVEETNRILEREDWSKSEVTSSYSPRESFKEDEERSRKRARIITEIESEEEKDEIERSIVAACSDHAHNDVEYEDDDVNNSHIQRINQYDDDEYEHDEDNEAIEDLDNECDYPLENDVDM